MERVRGKILKGEQVVFDNVNIGIDVEPLPSGGEAWSGGFTKKGLSDVERGGPYRLILEDGRSGNIMIDKLERSSSGRITVLFHGVYGSLQLTFDLGDQRR